MLKTLYKNDTTVTPYVATKNWHLSNIDNSDLILSEGGNPIISEQVIYTLTEVITSSVDCDIAKEDQSLDLANVRDGLKISGIFYPQSDPVNIDGTYKRMVYAQIKTTFYNNYRDPTKMWGLEKIDFDSSNTKKFLPDSIKILEIPTKIMGEKIVEGTIEITDNSIDDLHLIIDDGQNNLFAGINLFSKRQELGDYKNTFISGSNLICDNYFNFPIPIPISLELNWNNMIWDISEISSDGHQPIENGGGGIITAVGDTVFISINGGSPAESFTDAIAYCHGSLIYTGPFINCKMTISDFSVTGTSGAAVWIDIIQDGVTIYTNYPNDISPQLPHTEYFSLSEGVNSVIEVVGSGPVPQSAAVAWGSDTSPGYLTFTMKLENI